MTQFRTKYKSIRCEADGFMFDSKAERKRYYELQLLKKTGEILFFLRQVPFDLPGAIKYRCDFVIFWQDGKITYEDVKGFETKEFKLKKKLLESTYPITLNVLKLR